MPISPGKTTRVIRASMMSPAGIIVEETGISIIGTPLTFVKVSEKGTGIRGPESHVSIGPMRRYAGMWVDQIEFLQMIPKTIITPIPQIMPMPPMMAMVNLQTDVAFFAAMLA